MTHLPLSSSVLDEDASLRASGVPPVFGYVSAPGSDAVSVRTVGDVRRVDPLDGRSGLALFAAPGADVRMVESPAHQARVYVWGQPSHSSVRRKDVPEWCAAAVARQQFGLFRDLLGTFVVLVDEPMKGRLTIVTDVLGIRPMFTSAAGASFVFGSSVWALVDAGLITPTVDYDAVSSWVAYGFNCTDGSLFAGVRRVPPGAALVVEDGRMTTVPYATWTIGARPQSVEQAAEDIHEIVSADVRTVLREEPSVVVPLSGGYDSRYLLALCKDLPTRLETVVNVSFSPAEGEVATRVAEALEVRLETVKVDGSVWDIYDTVHYFTPDGFPISRFVTFCLAQRSPSIPMMNGFLGDSLVRGSNDRFDGADEDECGSDLASVLQQKHLAISLNLFRPELSARILDRARVPMADAVARGGRQVFGWADLYLRQRHYIACNFLQHLDSAEAVLPFYSWRLIAYKLAHGREAFSRLTYLRMFERHFPQLAAVPHAADLPDQRAGVAVADCAVRWARELMVPLVKSGWLTVLSTRHCLSLVSLGTSRLPALNEHLAATVEDAVFTCRRLYLLEHRLRDAGFAFSWNAL